MSVILEMYDVNTAEVYDTVTLTGSDQITYRTGRARSIMASALNRSKTPREAFALAKETSNGYTAFRGVKQ